MLKKDTLIELLGSALEGFLELGSLFQSDSATFIFEAVKKLTPEAMYLLISKHAKLKK
jgi:hypothetical protein